MTDPLLPPMVLLRALPVTRTPFLPLRSADLPDVLSPTRFGSSVMPLALPLISTPLPRLPENTFVRARLLPPLDVT